MGDTASQLFLVRLSRRASVCLMLVGALVLIGWLLHIQFLKSAAPAFIAMNPLTAVLFVIGGGALLRASNRGRKRPDAMVLVCGVILLLGGATKVVECCLGVDFNFDQLLFHKQ